MGNNMNSNSTNSNNNNADQDGEKATTPLNRSRPASSERLASSPGSQSNSSSSRQNRVVELLQDDSNQPANWIISPEFFDEDVAHQANDETSSASTTTTGDENEDFLVDMEHQQFGQEDQDEVDEYVDVNDEGEWDDEDNNHAEDISMYGDDEHDHNESDDEISISGDDIDMNFVRIRRTGPSSDESDEDSDQAANYDTALPASHRYLGENLEESRGRRVLIENTTINLPLFNFKHIVLLPGQELPITTSNSNPRVEETLLHCIRIGMSTIGLVSNPQQNPIGTTAEIRNYSQYQENEELKLIIIGRQRFLLLSAPFEAAIEGLVRILPEINLGPYPTISSLQRFHQTCHRETPSKFIISKHPHWLFRKYQASSLLRRIKDEIKNWCQSDLTKDAIEFSYWLTNTLPITNTERMKALTFHCTEARLMWLLDMLEKSEVFGCSYCRNVICYKEDVFAMSRYGPQCSFVNAGGFIHDTLTVRRARGLIQEYSWSSEFSWFPGYQWRMAHCDTCNRHIGWCYKRLEPPTKPKRFFGLSRASVRLQSSSTTIVENRAHHPEFVRAIDFRAPQVRVRREAYFDIEDEDENDDDNDDDNDGGGEEDAEEIGVEGDEESEREL